MGPWIFRLGVVVLLAIAATGTWYYGSQFTHDLKLEHDAESALQVPVSELTELGGQGNASKASLPLHIVNSTIWHLTMVTLTIETADSDPPLQLQIIQNFRSDPWRPGSVDAREVFLAPQWGDRPVRYRVVSAEGFQ